ncbi:YeiH family protein [Paramicrobacterium chengjingii]|uniref:Sulfate exporter family transporter n=1 Tax=Paramicrobacterium chengjingii TaxID=2769067 RepID=A0ABX6YL09_9MICO|nr:putative sulfate exporter family transporter [Microbacterium chengjingii]QPZ39030.1 putative sulfate exporter family transporter [Microbacterium chengjingii]
MSNSTAPVHEPQTRRRNRIGALLPGLGLCAVAVVAALTVNHLVPAVSALLIAIVLGMLLRNLVPLPAVFDAGLAFSAKKLLRLGVVLLGLQLVVGDILGLGAGVIVVVIAIVVGGIVSTLLIGKLMGISFTQRLLIACGFSICGAAAVAAVDGVVEPDDDEEVVTAIALVVLFGTLMIPLVPLAAGALGLGSHDAGLWAGGSIHEVAQVVAAGGIIGGGALGVAVIVKLARVLMLAPVMAVISAVRRRQSAGSGGKRPPIMPLFVFGFIVMVALRSIGLVPAGIVDAASVVQNALLASAMFALGAGVKIRNLVKVGPKPFALAACSTIVVAGIALAGVMIVA